MNALEATPANTQLPVDIIAADVCGQQFFETTQALAIHRNGVLVSLANDLAPDSEVVVHNPDTDEEAAAYVVGRAISKNGGHVYGLAFLDRSANLWHRNFPAAAPRIVRVECSGCRSVMPVSLSDIEWELFQITRELTLSCEACKANKVWKAASLEVTGLAPAGSQEQPKIVAPVASPMDERRKNRRTKMRMDACIKFSGMETIVACEDVSRGGFRFTSHREFPDGMQMEAAAPYARSSTNIFCLARITYCHRTPDGKFRHGVSYIQKTDLISWDPLNR